MGGVTGDGALEHCTFCPKLQLFCPIVLSWTGFPLHVVELNNSCEYAAHGVIETITMAVLGLEYNNGEHTPRG